MKFQLLVAGIILLAVGGAIVAWGFAEFSRCTLTFFSTCDLGPGITLFILGGVVSFIGTVATFVGVAIGAAPHLKGLTPILQETVVAKEILIQCRSCGSRYPQGTLKCSTCGANL